MSPSRTPKRFLVVEPDPAIGATVADALQRYGAVDLTHTAQEAEPLLHAGRVGVVLEPRLEDADGLELVRRHSACCRPFVLVHSRDASLAEPAYALGCHYYLPKPASPSAFATFGHRAVAAQILAVGFAQLLVAELAQRRRLSAQQTRILALEIAGIHRKRWAALLGVRPSTLHTLVHETVQRLGVLRLSEAARPIVRAVLAPHLVDLEDAEDLHG
jgi:DNA-binding NarL/FixJ family response regulator